MSSTPLQRIAIVGDGLAGRLTAASLSAFAPPSVELVIVPAKGDAAADALYGHAATPSAYGFFLNAGVAEPDLLLKSDAAFSFGSRYVNWPGASGPWTQCFSLPPPVLHGVDFHHYLTQRGEALEPYLVGAQAAGRGVFAHPPNDPASPLSRAEYGYHVGPASLTRLLGDLLANRPVRRAPSPLADVHVADGHIGALTLRSGDTLTADLFVDASGPQRTLLTALGAPFAATRTITARLTRTPAPTLGPPMRLVEATPQGWRAATPLQGGVETLTVVDGQTGFSEPDPDARTIPATALGRTDAAWLGNAVAVGHAAAVADPVTPAPLMLLMRDMERLAALLPSTLDAAVERREFNRRFVDDVVHAELFQRALFETDAEPTGAYWRAAAQTPVTDLLARKLTQFGSRGLLVAYDLEPFSREDWTVLHFGMGRRPRRHDRRVEAVSKTEMDQRLDQTKRAISALVSKMPPHHIYMERLKQYLGKKHA